MENRIGKLAMIAGAMLVAAALLLLLYNLNEDQRAGRSAEAVLPDIQAFIANEDDIYRFPGGDMTVREIDGYGYIGYLFIPELDLELPVMSEWDEERLKIAPCRHFGSTWDDDLVIAGHNYKLHFGTLPKLEADANVFFTDMDGVDITYKVKEVVDLQPTDVDMVRNSDWDLTLYTCTYGGQNRVAIGCERVE